MTTITKNKPINKINNDGKKSNNNSDVSSIIPPDILVNILHNYNDLMMIILPRILTIQDKKPPKQYQTQHLHKQTRRLQVNYLNN